MPYRGQCSWAPTRRKSGRVRAKASAFWCLRKTWAATSLLHPSIVSCGTGGQESSPLTRRAAVAPARPSAIDSRCVYARPAFARLCLRQCAGRSPGMPCREARVAPRPTSPRGSRLRSAQGSSRRASRKASGPSAPDQALLVPEVPRQTRLWSSSVRVVAGALEHFRGGASDGTRTRKRLSREGF